MVNVFGFSLLCHAINLGKVLTFPILGCLLLKVENFSLRALLYLTLHGSYGVFWVLKQSIFPDASFQIPVGQFYLEFLGLTTKKDSKALDAPLFILTVLSLFIPLTAGIDLIMDKTCGEISPVRVCFAVLLFCFGLFFHVGADAQKYFQLKYKKDLITNGFFAIVRSPAFLGEYMIYCAFFSLSDDPYKILISCFLNFFLGMPTFIYRKEKSLARYPAYSAYKAKVPLLIPFWRSWHFEHEKD